MAVRSNGASAGFGWVTRGISVGFRHPKPLLGGTALLVVALLIPSLLQILLQFLLLGNGNPPNASLFAWIAAAPMLLTVLILPLYAGYMQMIDATERGLPARARDIFKPYRDGTALNIIGYAILLMAIYLVVFGLVILLTGRGIPSWYLQLVTAQASHLPAPSTLPEGFGLTFASLAIAGLFMTGVYAISFCEVALRRRGVFGAIGDGVIGALKNLLPLLVFALSLILAWIGIAIVFGIIAVLLGLAGKIISPWMIAAVLIPLYIAFMLFILPGMFGMLYHLWRDVCADDALSGTGLPLVA